MFIPALFCMVLFFSGFVYWQKVIGSESSNPVWNQEHVQFQTIENKLLDVGFSVNQLIFIGNPPGYFVTTGRTAFAIPDGDMNTLKEVAQKYNVQILAIDENHPKGLDSFYQQGISLGGFNYLFNVGKYQIYTFKGN